MPHEFGFERRLRGLHRSNLFAWLAKKFTQIRFLISPTFRD